MGLTSTDFSSLTAIAVGTVIGIGLTALAIREADTDAAVRHRVTTEQVEWIRADEAGLRVHHDDERLHEESGVIQRLDSDRESRVIRLGVEGTASQSDPLIYVDGVRVSTMPELSPLDIDRIEILKDQAAIRLFGEDAADGVVQIFTKAAAAENPGR